MYACPACNRSAKNDQFPLAINSSGAVEEDVMFTTEAPLLLDPYLLSFVEHIQHLPIGNGFGRVEWRCFPRLKSRRGRVTIDVLKLNRSELLELRDRHYENHLAEHVDACRKAIAENDAEVLSHQAEILLRKTRGKQPFSALTFDVITQMVPEADLLRLTGARWPRCVNVYS
jgi:hypothetical protein